MPGEKGKRCRSVLESCEICGLAFTAGLLAGPLAAGEPAARPPPLGPPPGVVVAASPSPGKAYIGTPAIAILPGGSYVAAHDFFGRSPLTDLTCVYGSRDRGATWTPLAEIRGQAWFSLFFHRGALYLHGTASRYGDLTIRRSTDGGRTWTEPRDERSGLLIRGRFHGAQVPVVVHAGRIWRAVEERVNDESWPLHFSSLVVSAPEDADLLDARNWIRTNGIRFEPRWFNGRRPGWLEGNVVVAPGGRLVNLLRVHTEPGPGDASAPAGGAAGIPRYEVGARCEIAGDGRTQTFDPASGFIHLPGSQSKFTIRFDPRTRRYWSLIQKITNPHEGHDWRTSPIHQRNVLMLTSSADLRTWREESIVLRWREGEVLAGDDRVAWQYLDWRFDGGDLVAVSRTSWGGQNYHNANLMTFHRVRNFRVLTMADSPPDLATAPGAEAAGERQLTTAPHGHMLTNINVWSPDSRWIVYDVRSRDDRFDGQRIEQVNVQTGEVQRLYEAKNGAGCAVVTYSPREPKVVFIHGPENPTDDWSYAATRRRGALVDGRRPGVAEPLDAMNYAPPFTPGALRGGSHVHVFSPDGRWVSFTYEDEVLARLGPAVANAHDLNQRNVGVSVPAGPVRVARTHPRNHDGDWFSVLVTRTVNRPRPGSDEISRAFEEGWIGRDGYVRPDGSRQRRALAFLGLVTAASGREYPEVFVVDLPGDLTRPGDAPLAGTAARRPAPPRGVTQRRLTFTADRPHPGVTITPRHWMRSSPDGAQIAFLMKDAAGVVQLWTVSPNGGAPRPVTHNASAIASAFTWSPDGRWIAHVMDNSVFATEVASGRGVRLTPRATAADSPLAFACVFSPDGRHVAYMRNMGRRGTTHAQIFTVEMPQP